MQPISQRIDELIPAANSLPETAGTRCVAADIMSKRGFNPIEKMIDLYERLEQHEQANDSVGLHSDRQIKLLTTLAKFYAPQPKSLDVSVRSDNQFTITTLDYAGYIDSRQHLIPQAYRPALMGVVETVDAD